MADNTFETDYAQNNRSSCKGPCKEKILKGELRLVKVHKSGFSDDKLARDYYHPKCMFKSFHRVKEGTRIIEKQKDIKGLADLKRADREKIQKLLEDWKAGKISPPQRAAPTARAGAGKKKPTTTRGQGTKRKREERPKRPKGIFGGVVFAIEGPGRLLLTEKIESEGGRVVGSITQLVSYVITDDKEAKSAKLQRAKANGKKLVSPDWIDKKIKEGVRVISSSSSSSEEESSSSSSEEQKKKRGSGKKDSKKDSSKNKNKSEESSAEEEKDKGEKNKNKNKSEESSAEDKDKSDKHKKKQSKSEEEGSDSGEGEPPKKKRKKGDAPDVSKMVVCVSGKFENPRRTKQVLHTALKKAGATVTEGINKEVTHLLVADPTEKSGKFKQAKEYGIEIVEIDFFGSIF